VWLFNNQEPPPFGTPPSAYSNERFRQLSVLLLRPLPNNILSVLHRWAVTPRLLRPPDPTLVDIFSQHFSQMLWTICHQRGLGTLPPDTITFKMLSGAANPNPQEVQDWQPFPKTLPRAWVSPPNHLIVGRTMELWGNHQELSPADHFLTLKHQGLRTMISSQMPHPMSTICTEPFHTPQEIDHHSKWGTAMTRIEAYQNGGTQNTQALPLQVVLASIEPELLPRGAPRHDSP
jgi:hypothetical protein